MIKSRPYKIMGILNATPNSFSGDGSLDLNKLVRLGISMLNGGADLLDIGGESSAPYAEPVSAQENTRRVVPVIRELRKLTDKSISIDSYHPETVIAALAAGATIINDITGFENPDMFDIAVENGAEIIIMHMQGSPETMQDNPCYHDAVDGVSAYLKSRYEAALSAGIDPDKIILDPGIGFGKNLEHNLALIRNLESLRVNGCRLLLGASRKSMLGQILDKPVEDRLAGSLAAASAGILNGADIVRVHDVIETHEFLTVFNRIQGVLSR